jgi:GcrA cell cycle regulator
MSWTDERVEVLKKMWGEGQSASVIAKELGGVTRNAVIGKVHRLGLSNRVTSTTAKPATKEKAKTQAKAKPRRARDTSRSAKTSRPGARDHARDPACGAQDHSGRPASAAAALSQ